MELNLLWRWKNVNFNLFSFKKCLFGQSQVKIDFFSHIRIFENMAFGHVTEVPVWKVKQVKFLPLFSTFFIIHILSFLIIIFFYHLDLFFFLLSRKIILRIKKFDSLKQTFFVYVKITCKRLYKRSLTCRLKSYVLSK